MRFLAITLLLLIQGSCFAQNTVRMEIEAPKFKDGTKMKITLSNPFLRRAVNVKEFSLINGKSQIEFPTGNGDRFFLSFNDQSLGLNLEPGAVKVNIPDTVLKDATVTGSKSTLQMKQWLVDWKKEPIYEITRKAQNKWFEPSAEEVTAVSKKKYDSVKVIYDQQRMNFNIKWIASNPEAYIASNILGNSLDVLPKDQLKALYEGLNTQAKGNLEGRFIKYSMDSLFVNGTAPAFEQADTSGHLIKLADFRGKYVLLDFWASWCVPCRAENPNLIKAYHQFKDRNFTIFSVSLDSERKPWLEAIKKDQLLWAQVSELKGWDNSASTKYSIKAVPFNVLISPDGKIIAENIRGKALIATLEKLVK